MWLPASWHIELLTEFAQLSSRYYKHRTPNGGAPVKIGNMLAVKVRYRQGVASQSGSESWVDGSNPIC